MPRRRLFNAQASDGYAAIDAMVAMLILALAIGASINGLSQARKLARRALEAQQARVITQHLFAVAPPPAGSDRRTGRTEAFAWTLDTLPPVRTSSAGAFCERHLSLRGNATGHVYSASMAEGCSGASDRTIAASGR